MALSSPYARMTFMGSQEIALFHRLENYESVLPSTPSLRESGEVCCQIVFFLANHGFVLLQSAERNVRASK